MYDKPGWLCRSPCKSHMADHVIFKFWVNFCMAFVSAAGWPMWHGVGAKAFDVHNSKTN